MRQSNGRWPRRRGPAPASARDAGACLGSETDREANSEQRAERQLQPTHLPQRTDRRAAVRARPPSGVALPASLRGYELGRCWPLRGPHAGRRGAGTGRRLAGFAGCNTAVNLPGGSAVTWSHNRGVSRHAGNASRVPAGSTPNLNRLSGKQSWVEHRTILPGRSYLSNNPDRNRPERRNLEPGSTADPASRASRAIPGTADPAAPSAVSGAVPGTCPDPSCSNRVWPCPKPR